MIPVSRNCRRRLVYLTYCIANHTYSHCKIEQDPLRYMYPDTNYGVTITLTTHGQARHLAITIKEAFDQRGYITHTNIIGPVLEISGFYIRRNND